MLKLEAEARAVLASIRAEKPGCKDDVRRILLRRKLENLLKLRAELKDCEGRAIALMRKVDYGNIRPSVALVSKKDAPLWKYFRHVVSSAPHIVRPFRCLLYWCYDQITGGVLGFIDIGSEMQSIGPRDRYIGWTKEQKFGGGLRRVANVGTCVCVEPFGKLTGGKFQIVVCTSDRIVADWKARYGDTLGAVATTSLYGKSSVYNRLKEFHYLGNTHGLGVAHLDDTGYYLLKKFVNQNGISWRAGGTGACPVERRNVLEKTCQLLKVKPESISSHQPRGCYFAELGPRALEWLRGEIADFVPECRSVDAIADWWLARWYVQRWGKMSTEIDSFDFAVYRVDNQIDLCRQAQRAGSADSGTPADQAGSGGAIPTPALSEK